MSNFVLPDGSNYEVPLDFKPNTETVESFEVDLQDYYDMFTARLAKTPEQLVSELSAFKLELNHYALGIGGEVGELQDGIKKHTIYNKELDVDNIIEELGDIEWFAANIRRMIGVTREHVLMQNIEKLSKRYNTLHYSNEAASGRADKQPDITLTNPDNNG